MPYRLNEATGIIDYDKLQENALLYRPKILIAGTSAYSRHIDYERMRKIADSVGGCVGSRVIDLECRVMAGLATLP